MQQQIQVNKQKFIMLQEQKQSNNTMCTLFCTFEAIYENWMKIEQNTFGYYDVYDFKKTKNTQELLDQQAKF